MGPLADVTANEVIVRYTNSDTFIAEGSEVGVNDKTYTFDRQIETGTVAFEVLGLQATFLSIASLSGNYAFSLVGGELIAIGGVSASIGVGVASAGITDGEMGLLFRNGALAVEASGAVAINIAGLGSVSASQVLIAYNESGEELLGETLVIGDLSYEFQFIPASTGFLAVSVLGMEATFADTIYLRGNFGFSADDSTGELIVVGSK